MIIIKKPELEGINNKHGIYTVQEGVDDTQENHTGFYKDAYLVRTSNQSTMLTQHIQYLSKNSNLGPSSKLSIIMIKDILLYTNKNYVPKLKRE